MPTERGLAIPGEGKWGQLRARARSWWRLPTFQAHDHRAADREIALNRVLLGSGAAAYGLFLTATGRLDGYATLALNAAYLAVAVVVLRACRRGGGLSTPARHVLLGWDVGILSATFATAGPWAGPAFALYVWLLLGYSFRHGILYLRLAAVYSWIGFGAAVAASRYWGGLPDVVAGLAGTLFVTPFYLEMHLRKSTRATEQARDANHGKTLLLAGVGHQLRAPLAAIATAADHLARTRLGPEQAEVVASVRGAARSLSAELDDFLDVSRLDAGRVPVSADDVCVKRAVREALGLVAAEARSKGLLLAWHITARVPPRVCTDRRHLGKVLANLVSNAVRFTGAGSVLVTADAGIDAAGREVLRVEVSDTGLGIQHDARERIFEAFVQATPEILHLYGGAGLGLSVARRLVELLQGRIGADGEPGKGSRFWFEIPASAAAPACPPAGLPRASVVLLSPSERGTRAFARRLERLGAGVLHVDSVERLDEAVMRLADVDRLVLAVEGRSADAVEVARTLRGVPLFARVPLLLLAATPDLPTRAERGYYATSVCAASSDAEIAAAFRLVDSGTAEPERADAGVIEGGHGAEPPADRPAAGRPGDDAARGGPLRLLAVDDNASGRVVLRRAAEAVGHTCDTAEDGGRALEAVAEALVSEPFDAVLMDADMPGMDGCDTTSMIRLVAPELHDLPVVGVVDEAASPAARRCLEAGMAAVLTRPITPEDLSSVLRDVVPARGAGRTAGGGAGVDRGDDAGVDRGGGAVAPIARHPRFRPGLGPPLKDPHLSHLGLPGGSDLVSEVGEAFFADAAVISARLEAAIGGGDDRGFRDQLRALRGSAATVGASRLDGLCASGERMDGALLDTEGRALLRRIEDEVERVRRGFGRPPRPRGESPGRRDDAPGRP